MVYPGGEPDEMLTVLDAVTAALDASALVIVAARAKADTLRSARLAGESYASIETGASGPRLTDLIDTMLRALSGAGALLRRAQVRALYADGLTMEKAARLLGVSRQRVSALLREAPVPIVEEAAGALRSGGLSLTEPEFRMLAEALPFLVWVSDPNGATVYVNAAVTDYTGLPREAVYGWEGEALVHPDDAERARSAWAESVETETTFAVEYRLRRYDGTYRRHAFRAAPIRDPEGYVRKWIGCGTDVDAP